MASEPAPPPTVPIRDEVIRLGQFLKLAGLADSGADARELIEDEAVLVDGVVEDRRGRQLRRGAVVVVLLPGGPESAVVGQLPPPTRVSDLPENRPAAAAFARALGQPRAHPSRAFQRRDALGTGIADGVALVRQALTDLDLDAIAGDQRAVIEAGLAVVDESVAGLAPGEDPGLGLTAVAAALASLAEVAPTSGEVRTWIEATRRTVESLRRDAEATPAASSSTTAPPIR